MFDQPGVNLQTFYENNISCIPLVPLQRLITILVLVLDLISGGARFQNCNTGSSKKLILLGPIVLPVTDQTSVIFYVAFYFFSFSDFSLSVVYFNQLFVCSVVVYSDQLLGAHHTLLYLITI